MNDTPQPQEFRQSYGAGWMPQLVRVLPSEEGFYWWREKDERAWRMVQVVDFASGYEDASHLMTYDVQNGSWRGRSLKAWAEHFPIGEWVRVFEPQERKHLCQFSRAMDGTCLICGSVDSFANPVAHPPADK